MVCIHYKRLHSYNIIKAIIKIHTLYCDHDNYEYWI